jgi:hypothetical protein
LAIVDFRESDFFDRAKVFDSGWSDRYAVNVPYFRLPGLMGQFSSGGK